MLLVNNLGRTTCNLRTLFYLPHCNFRLTHNLLAANWSPGKLQKVVIFGDSFHTVLGMWVRASLAGLWRGLPPFANLALCKSGTCRETPVSDRDYPVLGAFSIQAMHTFPQWRVPEGQEMEFYGLNSSSGSSSREKTE